MKISIFILLNRNLDFEVVYNTPDVLNEEDRVDIVLGSDIVYGLHLARWLPVVLDKLLKPMGTFYGVMPKNRWVRISIVFDNSLTFLKRESINLYKIWSL